MAKVGYGTMESLAGLVTSARLETVPDEVIDIAKQRFADTIAVALIGSRETPSRIVAQVAGTLGGPAQSTIVSSPTKVAPDNAAMANGAMIHAMDWDNMLGPGGSYLGSTAVLPAVLAVGEAQGSSGREVLLAYILGVEVGARLAWGLNPATYFRGFHTTGLFGSFGSAAGVSSLLGLDKLQTQMAFGLAVHQNGAQFANKGYMAKLISGANAARAGILAGLLIQKGFTACPEILEEQYGVLDTFLHGLEGEYNVETIGSGVGEEWKLLANWAVKTYPVGGGRQTLIDAAVQLVREHSIQPDEVLDVEVSISPVLYKEDAERHRPQSPHDTRFSHPWCVAAAIVDGDVSVDHFGEERFADKRLWSLVDKTRLNVDEGGYTSYGWPSTVSIKTGRGTFSVRVEYQKGTVGNPTTWDDTWGKFRNCATPILGDSGSVKKMFDMIREVDSMNSITELTSLLALER